MKMLKRLSQIVMGGCAVLALASCGNEEKNAKRSYVTVEINPAVEIVLDGNDEVITINGLNDDGKMLINEEDYKGKDIDDIIKKIIEEAQECGYLVSSESENSVQRNISLSVTSSDDSHVAKLEAEVKVTVEDIIDKEKINAAFEKLEGKKKEHLAAIARQYDPSLTDEQINEMSDEELMKYVELATIEKAELATIEMEKYYLSMKEYEFQLQYKEQIAAELESVAKLVSAAYKGVINGLKTIIEQINQLQYNIFVSDDSQYLALLNKLNEYKDKNVVLNYKYQKGQTEEEGTEITIVIQTNKEQIEAIEKQITTIMNEFNNSLESLKAMVQKAIDELEVLEQKISNVNYNELLTKVETQINDSKNGLLAKFEEEHKADIDAAKASLKQRKETLESSINAK